MTTPEPTTDRAALVERLTAWADDIARVNEQLRDLIGNETAERSVEKVDGHVADLRAASAALAAPEPPAAVREAREAFTRAAAAMFNRALEKVGVVARVGPDVLDGAPLDALIASVRAEVVVEASDAMSRVRAVLDGKAWRRIVRDPSFDFGYATAIAEIQRALADAPSNSAGIADPETPAPVVSPDLSTAIDEMAHTLQEVQRCNHTATCLHCEAMVRGTLADHAATIKNARFGGRT